MNQPPNPLKTGLMLCAALAGVVLAFDAVRTRIFEADTHPVLAQLDPGAVVRKGRLQFVRDFELGQRLADENGMPRFYFFTAKWCTYCHEMEKAAFADAGVQRLAENFICVVVDGDQQPKICQRRRVTGFPTIQILSPDGILLHHLEGVQSAADLTAAMRSAMQRLAWLEEGGPIVR